MYWIMEDGEVIAGPFETIEACGLYSSRTREYGDSIVGPCESRPSSLSELLNEDGE